MKIVCIGSGNVATHLVTALHEHNFNICQVYSRTYNNAQALADKVGAFPVSDLSQISTDADIYIFSVKDSALEDVLSQMPKTDGIWVHTGGSVPMNIFEKYTFDYGVIYPFQTFSKNRKIDWKTTPIFIEGVNKNVENLLITISKQLSGKVDILPSEKRKYLHLTGVFACNFVNHMYALSEEFLNKADLPFDVALPLINETCAKVYTLSPKEAQTGPAVRFDENVMNSHLEMIDNERVKEIYKLISENIYNNNK